MTNAPEDIRELQIASGVMGSVLSSLLMGFLCVQANMNLVFAAMAALANCSMLLFGIFAPIQNRTAYLKRVGFVISCFFLLLILANIDVAAYKKVANATITVVYILIVLVFLVLFFIFTLRSLGVDDGNASEVSKLQSSDQRSIVPKSEVGSQKRVSVPSQLVIYKVDSLWRERLIDLLNQSSVSPTQVATMIEDGAKNSIISFKYKKLTGKPKRRKVQVKRVDRLSLGCIEISTQQYKNFRLDRISEVRAE